MSKTKLSAQQIATDIFHEWTKLPDYEPIDEDMAIALVCSIRDVILMGRTNNKQLEAQLRADHRSFERIGGMCGTPNAVEGCQNILKEAKRMLERTREMLGGE